MNGLRIGAAKYEHVDNSYVSRPANMDQVFLYKFGAGTKHMFLGRMWNLWFLSSLEITTQKGGSYRVRHLVGHPGLASA